jgi:opacity protein-like surface antigen
MDFLMKKHVLALGLVAAIAVPASANGLYVYGDAGRSTHSVDTKYWKQEVSANSFAFGAGYGVNDNFAFEAGYHLIGNYTLDEDDDIKLNSSALEVSGVAKYPLNAQFNVYGRLGFAKWSHEFSYEGSGYDSYTETTNKAFYGIGASYILNDQVSLRAEYRLYEKWIQAEVSNATIGAVYSF